MKDFSTEIIEIGGMEYTLFLNRRGVVAFERVSKLLETMSKMEQKYSINEEIEVDPYADPIKTYGIDVNEDDEKIVREVFAKFYWIALSENYHFNLDKATELFEQAIQEYGIEQLIALAYQMIEDANKEDKGTTELKNLKALRPKKTK